MNDNIKLPRYEDPRRYRFGIFLTDEERRAIAELSRREGVAVSTLARRALLTLADKRGIHTPPGKTW